MSEENKQENQEPQLTPIELKAKEQGWVPQDEWTGDAEQWRPAKEFLDRGELFKKIDDQNRTIKEFKKALEDMAKHHDKVRKVEYERALSDLKAAKKIALAEGDADAVVDIDEKMTLVREEQSKAAPVVQVPDVPVANPVFDEWVRRNSWYENSKAMRAYADNLGNELGARRDMSPTEILRQVEAEVKKEFAHKFSNPNRDKPGAVEGGNNGGRKTSKDDFQLTDEQRRVMQRFVRTIPGFDEKKYIEELKKVNGV
jgi:hypothetical protein